MAASYFMICSNSRILTQSAASQPVWEPWSVTSAKVSSESAKATCRSRLQVGRCLHVIASRCAKSVVPVTPFAILYGYYAKLRPGLSLEDWIDTNNIDTDAIDVRRMISFGVIKGFIRRVFAYPVWLDHPSFHAAQRARQAALRAEEAPRGRKKPMKDETPGQLTPTLVAAPALAVDISTDIAAAFGSLSTTAKSPGIKSVKTQLQSAYPPELPDLLDGEHSTDEVSRFVLLSSQQYLTSSCASSAFAFVSVSASLRLGWQS